MPIFRKKPVVVEAVQFTGQNDSEIAAFCPVAVDPPERGPSWLIPTLEGTMRADVGDWIVRGVRGEFYPCKADIFALLYDPIEPGTETKEV